jgi:hypothetical protein
MNSENLSKNTLIILIGLIASCIGIFSFFSGFQSIREIPLFSKSTPISAKLENEIVQAIPTPSKSNKITPSLTYTPLPEFIQPSPTYTQEPIVFDTDYPGMRVQFSEFTPRKNSDYISKLIIHPVTPKFVVKGNWSAVPIQKDIAGNWAEVSQGIAGESIEQLDDGTVEIYLMDHHLGYVYITNTFVQSISCWRDQGFAYPIVPIIKNKVTEVDLSFGILEIGVLSNDGSVKSQASVNIENENDQVSAGLLPHSCSFTGYTQRVDERGVATFVVVGGKIIPSVEFEMNNVVTYPGIKIEPGEYKQVIFKES